jgi:hypothetical protein
MADHQDIADYHYITGNFDFCVGYTVRALADFSAVLKRCERSRLTTVMCTKQVDTEKKNLIGSITGCKEKIYGKPPFIQMEEKNVGSLDKSERLF